MQTARGRPVVPSQRSLETARRLLNEAEVTELDQPTGTTWSVLPIVTPDGLIKHFVELSCLDQGVEVRGMLLDSSMIVSLSKRPLFMNYSFATDILVL